MQFLFLDNERKAPICKDNDDRFAKFETAQKVLSMGMMANQAKEQLLGSLGWGSMGVEEFALGR